MPSNNWPSASFSHTSRPHGSRCDQLGRPGPDLVGGQQLAAGEDLYLGDVHRGPLVGHGELGQAVDLVAPQVDAHGHVGGGGEHVDDRAPHGHLAPVLDLVLPPVAGRDQSLDELGGVDLVAVADDDRLDVLGGCGAEALEQRPDRRHDEAGGPLGVGQAPQRAQAAAHGLHARADPLEGQRLPGGKTSTSSPPR